MLLSHWCGVCPGSQTHPRGSTTPELTYWLCATTCCWSHKTCPSGRHSTRSLPIAVEISWITSFSVIFSCPPRLAKEGTCDSQMPSKEGLTLSSSSKSWGEKSDLNADLNRCLLPNFNPLTVLWSLLPLFVTILYCHRAWDGWEEPVCWSWAVWPNDLCCVWPAVCKFGKSTVHPQYSYA